jgi:biopolymer transport protein ExbD
MKFNKKQKDQSSEISTASMPDIVFLLLFFFMVSATIKPKEDMLRIDDPKAHAVTAVKKKFLIKELHIGVPKNSNLGTSPRISDGENLLELSQIGQWVHQQKAALGEMYGDQLIVLLKADENLEMGIINDVQLELRKNNARKVLFRTLEGAL